MVEFSRSCDDIIRKDNQWLINNVAVKTIDYVERQEKNMEFECDDVGKSWHLIFEICPLIFDWTLMFQWYLHLVRLCVDYNLYVSDQTRLICHVSDQTRLICQPAMPPTGRDKRGRASDRTQIGNRVAHQDWSRPDNASRILSLKLWLWLWKDVLRLSEVQ